MWPSGNLIVRELIRFIGDDPDREGLKMTPARVCRSVEELFSGYKDNPKEILKIMEGEVDYYDEIIVVKDIDFTSFCQHHLLPFQGVAHVGYLPSELRICGLSKLARLVDCYAKRLQIQEKLTRQIADAIEKHLQPRGVGVIVESSHMCLTCRGAKKPNARMVTSALLGTFKDSAPARAEFISLIGVKP